MYEVGKLVYLAHICELMSLNEINTEKYTHILLMAPLY